MPLKESGAMRRWFRTQGDATGRRTETCSREEITLVVPGPVKAIVIGSHTLKDLLQYQGDDYLTIYIVDSQDISELVHEGGKWQPSGAD
jgi:hypothetical protein